MVTEMTGIAELDYVTGGLPPFGLTLLIGPPGTGKTVMALQIAMNHARQGNDAIFFSAFSEPHEKLLNHLSSFTFFDPQRVGDQITMLSLKSTMDGTAQGTLEVILQAARGKKNPLIIVDGFRGLYQRLGGMAAQDLLSGLSSQMPYLHGRCLVTSETLPTEANMFFELSPADVLITLSATREGAQPVRSLEVIKVRGHAHREGLHGLNIDSNGVQVYPRLAASMPPETPPPPLHRQQFDLPGFDAMLGGGLPECSTTVFIGDVGTGRTTFSLHYLLAGARRGEHGLLVSLADAAVDLQQKARELGLHLDEALEAGLIQIIESPAVELDPYRLAWNIHEVVTKGNIKRLVIDSVTGLEGAPGVQQSQRDYLAAIALYLRRQGVTTVMTQDFSPRGMASLLAGGVRMPPAHNRVSLARVSHRGRTYRMCSVLNMQRSAHDTSIHEFVIEYGGIRILEAAETDQDILSSVERELSVSSS